jgi:hypothetical protein
MSRPNYWVTFRSALPEEDPDNPNPKGFLVASRLADGLRGKGIHSPMLDNWRDAGYSIDCQIDERPVYAIVSHLGDGARQWVICCTSDQGAIRALLTGSDTAQRLKLARMVDAILRSDHDVSDVRWYPAGWNGDPTATWVDAPDGPDVP